MSNIPVLVFLMAVFFYYAEKHWSTDSNRKDSRSYISAATALLLFCILNVHRLPELANPLRDPMSFLMMLLSAMCIISFVQSRRHSYLWLVGAATTLAYSASCRETSIVIAVPLFIYAVYSKKQNQNLPFWKPLVIFAGFCLIAAIPLMIQNLKTTGNPFLPGQLVLRGTGAHFNSEVFRESSLITLRFIFNRYTILLVPTIYYGFVSAIKKQAVSSAISLPAVVCFYLLYCMVAPRAIWRYLMVLDFFVLPLCAGGIIHAASFITSKAHLPSQVRDKAPLITLVLLFLSCAMVGPLFCRVSEDRFSVKEAQKLQSSIMNIIPRDSRTYVEGKGFSQLINLCSELDVEDIHPEAIGELNETISAYDHDMYLLHQSEEMTRSIRREADLEHVAYLDMDEYKLGRILGGSDVSISRIIPWSSRISEKAIHINKPGRYIIKIDAGRLSKHDRTYARLTLDQTILTDNLNDYINYFTHELDAGDANIKIESDSFIGNEFYIAAQPLSEPIKMNFSPDTVVGYNSMIKPEPILSAQPHRMRFMNEASITIPTIDPDNKVFLVDIICSIKRKAMACKPRLSIRHETKTLFEEVIPEKNQRIQCVVLGKDVDNKSAKLDLDLDWQGNGSYIITVHSVTISRITPPSRLKMVCGSDIAAPDILGVYQPERHPAGSKVAWMWTDGHAKAYLFPEAIKSNISITVSYFDKGRPDAVSAPSPVYLVNGKHIKEVSTSHKEFESQKLIEDTFTLPATLCPDGICLLEIKCRTWRPADVGAGNDKRRLGLMLYSIKATE
ncbi:hypothetical protein BVX97_00975 [bacterium E08(2017)]|nr:hypothetical protein BVX97_00975 [bacterium E08(2017)]